MSRVALRVTVAVVLAFIVDGMDYQLLALVLPVLVKDLIITPVLAGLLVTITVTGMGIGGIAGCWLTGLAESGLPGGRWRASRRIGARRLKASPVHSAISSG